MTPSTNDDVTANAAATGHEAWGIFSRLVAGILVYGAVGWGLGNLLGQPIAGLAIGALLGVALGTYLSVHRIGQLSPDRTPELIVTESQSWSGRMARMRMERASEVVND